MDLDKYTSKYTSLSIDELKKMEALYFNRMEESTFEYLVKSRHKNKQMVKEQGRSAIQTFPLVEVLSVNVQTNENKDRPFVIYGKIYANSGGTEVHEFFNRPREAAEILETSNKLTLSGPEFSCWPPRRCTPLSLINVVLYDGDDNLFANEQFCLDDAQFEDDYAEVKCRVIPCVQGSVTVQYILIPFGVSCRVEVEIYNRNPGTNYVDVKGKIAARYGNTYGNCFEGECVLFEKQGSDFERSEFRPKKSSLKLSRCWVASPSYSPLVVTLDLSEFETSREILNKTIKLLPRAALGDQDSFVQEEMGLVIHVAAEWFQPQPFELSEYSPRLLAVPAEDTEEMDIGGEDQCSDEESDEESDDDLSSNIKRPWTLHPHTNDPSPSPAVEIFSVFIGREKSKAVQIYGSVQVTIYDDKELCYIFKRHERDALRLEGNANTTPILDGSRLLEDFCSLEMKLNIKDVDGPLAIKGFVDWEGPVLDSDKWQEKQLCSTILGDNGFAAVHYSIFSYAVWAIIKVYVNLKRGGVNVSPKVCGSIVTEYSSYDYSTRYKKDYYRIVLFKRSPDDSVQPSSDLPLSRSMVVVPSYSSLIVNVDLSFGDSFGRMLSCVRSVEIKINEGSKTIETADYSLRMEFIWREIK